MNPRGCNSEQNTLRSIADIAWLSSIQNLLRSHEQERHGQGLTGPALTPLAEAMAAAEEVELAMEEGKMAESGATGEFEELPYF